MTYWMVHTKIRGGNYWVALDNRKEFWWLTGLKDAAHKFTVYQEAANLINNIKSKTELKIVKYNGKISME